MHTAKGPFTALVILLVGGLGCAAQVDGSPEGAAKSVTFGDPTSLEPQSLDTGATDLIDVRGVGDAGWSGNKQNEFGAAFGSALDRFDATGRGYRGDLSFINWESVVGTHCASWSPERFGFLSHPDNITQAVERGFNLIGLSNNHTRDCWHGVGEHVSADLTINAMIHATRDLDVIWHGVAPEGFNKHAPKLRDFTVGGRKIRVAFNSVHLGRTSCPRANCYEDRVHVLQELAAVDADLRILSIHALEFGTDWQQIASVGAEFVRKYRGDVVFGHGPHVWKPPMVVEWERHEPGRKGVVFTSLGNFIHPSLGAQSRNLIGRALFDPESLQLRQVQIITVGTSGGAASYGTASPATLGGYAMDIPWQSFTDGPAHGAYVNLD